MPHCLIDVVRYGALKHHGVKKNGYSDRRSAVIEYKG